MMEEAQGSGGRKLELLRFLKAQLSSSTATAVDWGVVTCLVLVVGRWFHVHAVVLGALAGAVTDFSIKKWWVFGTANRHSQVEALRYAFVSGLSAALNGAAVYLLVDLMSIPLAVGVVLASFLIGVVWNYPMHRLFVFQLEKS